MGTDDNRLRQIWRGISGGRFPPPTSWGTSDPLPSHRPSGPVTEGGRKMGRETGVHEPRRTICHHLITSFRPGISLASFGLGSLVRSHISPRSLVCKQVS